MPSKERHSHQVLKARVKGKAEKHVGRAVGRAIETKAVADEVKAELLAAKEHVKEAGKTIKDAAKSHK